MKTIQEIRAKIEQVNRQREEAKQKFIFENPEPKDLKKCEHGIEVETNVLKDKYGFWSWEKEPKQCPTCAVERAREARVLAVVQRLQIPKRYQETPNVSEFYSHYKTDGGIIFSGTVGTGKTYEAISLARQIFIETEKLPVFRTGTEVAMQLRQGVGDKNLREVVESLKNQDVLLIDDLGVESATDFMLENLYVILNYRYNEMLPIILTTNLNSKEFADTYGQRMVSRLAEMAKFIKLTGEDKRISIKNK